MDTRIYVMTHKAIETINDDLYHILHVGKKGKPDLGFKVTIQEIIYQKRMLRIANLQECIGFGKIVNVT